MNSLTSISKPNTMNNNMTLIPYDNILHIAYRRLKMKTYETAQERKKGKDSTTGMLLLTVKILAISLYVFTTVVDYEKIRSAVLVLIAFLYGLLTIARYSLKFVKELIDVIKQWRDNHIKIEGAGWIYFIVIALVILCVLAVVLIVILLNKNPVITS